LDWFLYVDASDIAVGGVLVQRTSDGVQQVVAFVSQKFSKAARAWSTYEKKDGMCYAVGKFFTLLTDHRNLVWIGTSIVPKVIRIRSFLQTFDFVVMHIPGKDYVFAHWLSRMHYPDPSELEVRGEDSLVVLEREKDRLDEALKAVHNARVGHGGIRRTWLLLNDTFPGHKISVEAVARVVGLYPSKDLTAESLALALFQFFITYGVVETRRW
jgi:hypothetical protein